MLAKRNAAFVYLVHTGLSLADRYGASTRARETRSGVAAGSGHVDLCSGGCRASAVGESAVAREPIAPSRFEQTRINRHAGNGVDPDCVEGINLGPLADASSDDELTGGQSAEDMGALKRKALQGTFGIDVRV